MQEMQSGQSGKMESARTVRLEHPFPPLFREDSRILILGSFPSVKSREQNFFYGHPQNRFWKVLAHVFAGADAGNAPAGDPERGMQTLAHAMQTAGGTQTPVFVPQTVEEKRAFLLARGVALWDVIYSCSIRGSSDASIRDAVPTDLSRILEHSQVERIFVNGQTAFKLYQKYQGQRISLPAMVLPSTSPANAAWTLDKLTEAWRVILEPAE